MIKRTYGNHVAYDLKCPCFNAIKRSHRSGGVRPSQTLQAVQKTVIHEAPCVNRAAEHLQKPGRLAERRGALASAEVVPRG